LAGHVVVGVDGFAGARAALEFGFIFGDVATWGSRR